LLQKKSEKTNQNSGKMTLAAALPRWQWVKSADTWLTQERKKSAGIDIITEKY